MFLCSVLQCARVHRAKSRGTKVSTYSRISSLKLHFLVFLCFNTFVMNEHFTLTILYWDFHMKIGKIYIIFATTVLSIFYP